MIDLTESRQLFVDLLMPDTCTIRVPTRVPDGGGSWTDGAPTDTTSRCRFFLRRPGKLEQGGDQVQQRGDYGLALPIATAVPIAAEILVGTRTYRIVWQPPIAGLSFEQQLGLEEVR